MSCIYIHISKAFITLVMQFLGFHNVRRPGVRWPGTAFKPNCLDCQIITKNTGRFENYTGPCKAVGLALCLCLCCTVRGHYWYINQTWRGCRLQTPSVAVSQRGTLGWREPRPVPRTCFEVSPLMLTWVPPTHPGLGVDLQLELQAYTSATETRDLEPHLWTTPQLTATLDP